MSKKHIHDIIIPVIVLIFGTSGCSFYPYGKPTTGGLIREDVDPNIVHIINEFRTDVPKLMKKGKIPGCSVALVDKQGIIWSEGFGTTDYKRKIPVTPRTLFCLGSIGKTYTATAILLAVQDDILDLDEPITTYLREFKVYSRYEVSPGQKITLRHLLSHCAGIPHATPGCNLFEINDSFEDRVTSLFGTWLKYPVGEGYSYSGAGYDLAAYVLQAASGIPFEQYMVERIFHPLGLHNSVMARTEMLDNADLAIPHTRGIAEEPTAHGLLGAGGVWMSATDLARFVCLLMNNGALEGKRYLDESLINALLTPRAIDTGKNYEWLYGLGIMLGEKEIGERDVYILRHGGGGVGSTTMYEFYPEYGIGAVVLTNRLIHSVINDLNVGRRLLENDVIEKSCPAPSWDVQQCTPTWTGWTGHTPSAYKSEWKKYCGKYYCRISGYKIKWWAKLILALDLDQFTPRINVYEKSGYLCLTESKLMQKINPHPHSQISEKLEEVEPGLFFTASGTALDLRGKVPTWRNFRLKKR